MKTDELISLLAKDVTPVDPRAPARHLTSMLLVGAFGSLVIVLALYGLRPDLAAVAKQPVFWFKLAFPFALAVAALLATLRIGRPGVPLAGAWWGMLAPFVVLWVMAAVVLGSTPADAHYDLVMGRTWRSCPISIALIAVPLLIAVLWALKSLAPTQLRLAGAIGGLLAGAVSTLIYSLHCPEMHAPFWAVWYVSGIALPVAAGALAGPRVLRW